MIWLWIYLIIGILFALLLWYKGKGEQPMILVFLETVPVWPAWIIWAITALLDDWLKEKQAKGTQ